jgi:hypothetical protein
LIKNKNFREIKGIKMSHGTSVPNPLFLLLGGVRDGLVMVKDEYPFSILLKKIFQ